MGLSDSQALVIGDTQLVTGWSELKTQAAPGAGVATVFRVTPGETWERVQLARATFTASAAVANRLLSARIIDFGGNVYWETPIASTVVASGVVSVNLAVGVTPSFAAAGISVAPLPDVLLQSGMALQLFAGAIDAGDTWSTLTVYVQRFPSDRVHSGMTA
jgi:hypothetical protein